MLSKKEILGYFCLTTVMFIAVLWFQYMIIQMDESYKTIGYIIMFSLTAVYILACLDLRSFLRQEDR